MKDKWAILLILSFLPIWRSGEKLGLNFWQWVFEHTVFSKRRQWVELKDIRTYRSLWIELEEGEPKKAFIYTEFSPSTRQLAGMNHT